MLLFFKKIGLIFLFILLIILFFTNVEYIKNSLLDSAVQCLSVILPSLYPYILFSAFVPYFIDVLSAFSRLENRIISILGVCKIYIVPILLGQLCGFVNGPLMLCSLKEQYELKDDDFDGAVILSSNAGIGFTVGTVGVLFYQNIFFGLFLYFLQIALSFFLFFLYRKPILQSDIFPLKKSRKSFPDFLPSAVEKSTRTMSTVFSYLMFFRFLLSLLSKYFQNPFFLSLFASLLEFSTGITYATSLSSSVWQGFFVGFSIGFGGLCSLLQIASVCTRFPFSKIKYLLYKLLQGGLLGFACAIYGFYVPIASCVPTFLSKNALSFSRINGLFLLFVFFFLFCLKKYSKKY